MQALPLESFVSVTAEEALPNVLGLLLRTAVADGRISDEGAALRSARARGTKLARGRRGAGGRRVHLHGFALALHPGAHHAGRMGSRTRRRPSGTGWKSSSKAQRASGRKTSRMLSATWWPSRMKTGRSMRASRRTPSQAGWQPPAAPALWKALEDDGTGEAAPVEVQA